jgi:hypothetical protein
VLINGTISLVEANRDFVYLPEALRVKSRVLLSLLRRQLTRLKCALSNRLVGAVAKAPVHGNCAPRSIWQCFWRGRDYTNAPARFWSRYSRRSWRRGHGRFEGSHPSAGDVAIACHCR